MKNNPKNVDDPTELSPAEKAAALAAGWELRWTYDNSTGRTSLYPYGISGVVQPHLLLALITQNARNGMPLYKRALQLITASLQ